ncbi:hypothetical protein HK101_011015 [Irineochytrium annulatum]|nr:hypothetical protein HK101_011015 [Irineochytrium annulatum]
MNDPVLTPSSLAIARFELAVYAVGFVLNLLLLVAYIKHRRDILVRTIDYLFVLIIVVHLGLSVLYTWMQAHVTLIHGGYTSSPDSDVLCQASGTIGLVVSGNAVTAHMLIAIERLMTVVLGVKDTRPTLLTILAFVEALTVTAAVQTHLAGGFVPTESGLYCFFPFETEGADPARLAGTVLTAAYCAMAAVIVLFSYTYIYIRVIRTSRRATGNDVPAPDEKGPTVAPDRTTHGAGDRERKVFYRCVGVVLVFLSTYLLEFSTFAYKVMTGAACPDWWDALASLMTGVDAIATPALMLLMIRKVAEAAVGVVGMRLSMFAVGNAGRRVQPMGDVSVPVSTEKATG